VSPTKPSVAVLVSGLLANLGSAFAILASAFTLAALNLIPLPPTAPVTPSYVGSIANVSMLIFLGIAVFGIFTGIGLIQLRNWARISILVFSGLTVFFGGTALLVLLAIPFPINPSGPSVDPGAVKAVVLLVYGIPVLISIWWLVLFNLKGTKAQLPGLHRKPRLGFRPRRLAPCPFRPLLSVSFSLFCGCWSCRSCKCHFRPSFSGIRFTGQAGKF
jgi:hypothetical protein